MGRRKIATAGIMVLFLAVWACALTSTGLAETERISAKQLAAMLGRSDVVVVDVRSGSDWDKSDSKIKGAVREELSSLAERIGTYPREKILVFYCA